MRPPVTDRLVRVLSTKYDGSPHNDYVARLIVPSEGDDSSASLRVFVPVGTVIHSHTRGDFEIVTPFTQLFWPDVDCWWNVEHNHWPHPLGRGGLMLSYANISLPARLDDDTVYWVDLDLDIVVTEHGPELVDMDEFEEHRVRFGYPDDLVTRAHEAAAALLELAARREPPWDRETHIW